MNCGHSWMFPGPAGAHDFYQQVAAFERDVLPHSLQQRHAAHYPPFIAQHASVGVDEQLHIERERAWAAQRTAQDALRRVVAFRRMHDVENGQFAHNYARGDDVHRSNIQLLSRNAEPARSGYRHSTMDEEMRLDPADGHLHTLRGFLDYYGQFEGRERWAHAAITGTQPSFVAADTVTHADTAANMDVATDLHMVEPHIDHPSRSREYPDADHKRGAEARPGSDSYMHQYHTHPDTGEEMRIDAADGHLHTLQGFQDFYGDVEGGERWAKSPKTLAEAQAVGLRVAATDASVADPDQDLNAAPELTFSASELKDMMSGGMNDAVGGTDPTTGEQFEYVLLLTDEWRERFAQSEQIRWRKKGEFSFNRPKKHPVNKEATKERRKQQKQRKKEANRAARGILSDHESTVEVQNEQRKLMEAELASGVGGPQRWETIQELAASFNVRYDNFVKHQNPSYWPEMPLNF